RPGPGYRTPPERRAGAGVSAVGRLSLPEIRAAEQAKPGHRGAFERDAAGGGGGGDRQPRLGGARPGGAASGGGPAGTRGPGAGAAVHRGEQTGTGRKLSGAEAAREGLTYLRKAGQVFGPTPAFYAIRARCRQALGEEGAARADEKLARDTPA